jgi:hypothetical protein
MSIRHVQSVVLFVNLADFFRNFGSLISIRLKQAPFASRIFVDAAVEFKKKIANCQKLL